VENIEARTEGDYLILKIDLTKNCGYTGGYNNIRVASSHGNQPVPSTDGTLRPERWNLNVFRPLTTKERLERKTYPEYDD
jgi:hypothetical protein